MSHDVWLYRGWIGCGYLDFDFGKKEKGLDKEGASAGYKAAKQLSQ